MTGVHRIHLGVGPASIETVAESSERPEPADESLPIQGSAGPHAARGRPPRTRDNRPPRSLWRDTRSPGLPSVSRPKFAPDPGAASTHVAQDRSPAVRHGRIPCLWMEATGSSGRRLPLRTGHSPLSPGRPIPEPADASLPLHDTAGPHAAQVQTQRHSSAGPRTARSRTPGPWEPPLPSA